MPDRRRRAREVREDTHRPARREWSQRERHLGEPVRRERVRPRRARGDADSEEEAKFNRHEDYGDVPVHGVVPPTAPTHAPPPPPSWHGAWHSSGSSGHQSQPAWDTSPPGWHEGGPSGTQHEDDVFLDEILLDDTFLHTVQEPVMDRLAETFRTGRKVGITEDHHPSAPA
ncbi:uncharacterized protein DS421_6g190530 [Arachis hypogaea]|nr:uncharacterized protein DS421_6g190530 [Arachis hypogaea]